MKAVRIDDIVTVLSGPRLTIGDAEREAPGRPGLYAIHAGGSAWQELGLGTPPDRRPLYAGKSESSLAERDIKTHFGQGRTGQSTLRRSFAALLVDRLELGAQPRNPAKPERFANYGLSAADDAALTRWMKENVRLSFWAKQPDTKASLADVESAVIQRWQPPLNLSEITTLWTEHVKEARARMAKQAREWRP